MTKAPALRVGHRSAVVPQRPVLVADDWAPPAAPGSLHRVGRRVWRAVWQAGRTAYLPGVDSFAVEAYALLAERAEAFRAQLDTEGWTQLNARQQTVVHPLAAALNKVESSMQVLEDRLGLNPKARLGLGLDHRALSSSLDTFDAD